MSFGRLIAALSLMTLAMASAPAAAMTFRAVSVGGDCGATCPQVIAAEGEIDRDSAEAFAAFVRQRLADGRLRNIVFIHSQGGNVVGAIKLGALFRRAGSAVIVAQARPGQGLGDEASFLSARCMSACVYALMGGKKRVIPPQSQLGVHRASSFQFTGKDPANTDPGYQRIKTPEALVTALTAYAKSMGVSVAVIDAAQATPHETIRVLTRKELAQWRIGSERF